MMGLAKFIALGECRHHVEHKTLTYIPGLNPRPLVSHPPGYPGHRHFHNTHDVIKLKSMTANFIKLKINTGFHFDHIATF